MNAWIPNGDILQLGEVKKKKKQQSHLLVSNAFVSVVEFVGEQLPVARQRFVPAQGHGGRRVGHGLQVGCRAWDLDWGGGVNKQRNQELDRWAK